MSSSFANLVTSLFTSFINNSSFESSQDRALRREDDVALAQLLLHLADETAVDLLHALPRAVRHEDHRRLAALLDVHLLHRGDEDVPHVVLEVRRAARLQVKKRLRDLLLQLVRSRPRRLDDLLVSVEHGARYS